MKVLADEGVDAAIVARLRSEGHDAIYVAELAPGITDETLLELANGDGRVLMTVDKDFGELVFRQGRVTFGDPAIAHWIASRYGRMIRATRTTSAYCMISAAETRPDFTASLSASSAMSGLNQYNL